MIKIKIGENAGNIWKALKENGSLGANALKKITKLGDKDIYMGLGWLAREGKVTFEQKGTQLKISLAE